MRMRSSMLELLTSLSPLSSPPTTLRPRSPQCENTTSFCSRSPRERRRSRRCGALRFNGAPEAFSRGDPDQYVYLRTPELSSFLSYSLGRGSGYDGGIRRWEGCRCGGRGGAKVCVRRRRVQRPSLALLVPRHWRAGLGSRFDTEKQSSLQET